MLLTVILIRTFDSNLSLISALDEDGWLTPRPGRSNPENDPVPTVQEAGWAPGTVETGAGNLAPYRDMMS